MMDGKGVRMSDRFPDLGEKCGKYFTYRNLIEAGETWARYRIDNRPKEPATYQAMRRDGVLRRDSAPPSASRPGQAGRQ